jgi:hypothetical protein
MSQPAARLIAIDAIEALRPCYDRIFAAGGTAEDIADDIRIVAGLLSEVWDAPSINEALRRLVAERRYECVACRRSIHDWPPPLPVPVCVCRHGAPA